MVTCIYNDNQIKYILNKIRYKWNVFVLGRCKTVTVYISIDRWHQVNIQHSIKRLTKNYKAWSFSKTGLSQLWIRHWQRYDISFYLYLYFVGHLGMFSLWRCIKLKMHVWGSRSDPHHILCFRPFVLAMLNKAPCALGLYVVFVPRPVSYARACSFIKISSLETNYS